MPLHTTGQLERVGHDGALAIAAAADRYVGLRRINTASELTAGIDPDHLAIWQAEKGEVFGQARIVDAALDVDVAIRKKLQAGAGRHLNRARIANGRCARYVKPCFAGDENFG